jgi:tetratricopeptide (TPR) repeat protein
MKFTARFVFIILAITLTLSALGQDSLMVQGVLKDLDSQRKLDHCQVMVFNKGQQIMTYDIGKEGKYKLKLDLGYNYDIKFSCDEYVSKIYRIETEKMSEDDKIGGYQIDLPMHLFKLQEGFNIEIMNMPFGRMYFAPNEGTFLYDELYVKGMKAKISAEFERLKNIESEKEKLKIELDSLTNRGDDYMAEKKYNDALNAYSDALQLSPGDEKIQRKYNEAKQANERTVYPIEIEKQFELYISKADSAMQSKKWKTAKKYYSKALKIKPEESLPKEKIQEIESITNGSK